MKDIFKIYALYDPRKPNVIKYVGATGKPLRDRLSGHFTEARNYPEKDARTKWITKMFSDGIKPRIRLLRKCDIYQVERMEQEFIQRHRTSKLTNSHHKSVYKQQWYFTEITSSELKSRIEQAISMEILKRRFPLTAKLSDEHILILASIREQI